jgi:hypothetical protein
MVDEITNQLKKKIDKLKVDGQNPIDWGRIKSDLDSINDSLHKKIKEGYTISPDDMDKIYKLSAIISDAKQKSSPGDIEHINKILLRLEIIIMFLKYNTGGDDPKLADLVTKLQKEKQELEAKLANCSTTGNPSDIASLNSQIATLKAENDKLKAEKTANIPQTELGNIKTIVEIVMDSVTESLYDSVKANGTIPEYVNQSTIDALKIAVKQYIDPLTSPSMIKKNDLKAKLTTPMVALKDTFFNNVTKSITQTLATKIGSVIHSRYGKNITSDITNKFNEWSTKFSYNSQLTETIPIVTTIDSIAIETMVDSLGRMITGRMITGGKINGNKSRMIGGDLNQVITLLKQNPKDLTAYQQLYDDITKKSSKPELDPMIKQKLDLLDTFILKILQKTGPVQPEMITEAEQKIDQWIQLEKNMEETKARIRSEIRAELNSELLTERGKCALVQADLENLKKQLKDKPDDKIDAEAKLKVIEDEKKALETQLTTQQTRISELEHQLTIVPGNDDELQRARQELTDANAEITNLQGQINKLNDDIRTKDIQLTQLFARGSQIIDNLKKRITELNQSLKRETERADDAETNKKRDQLEIENLKEQIDELIENETLAIEEINSLNKIILQIRQEHVAAAKQAEEKAEAIAEATRIKAEEASAEAEKAAEKANKAAENEDAESEKLQAEKDSAEELKKKTADEANKAAEEAAAAKAARIKAEQEAAAEAARIKAEQEALAEVARIKAEEEAARIKAEKDAAAEAARIKAEKEAAAEAARIKAEKEAAAEAARIKAEKDAAAEAARIKAEKEAAAEAARIKAEKEAAAEAARIKAEKDAAAEAARIKAEQDAAAEAARIKDEQEAAAEAARIKAEQEAAAEAARIKAEQEAASEAARIKAEKDAAAEAARIKAEQEAARIKAEQEALAEAARIKAEKEAAAEAARIKAEKEAATEAARIKAEKEAAAEASRIKAEKEAATEAARIKAEQEAAAESARIKAEKDAAAEAARIKAEQEAAAESARIKAEQEAAAESARIKAEQEAASEAARIKAEKDAAAEAARIKAEQDAAAEAARIKAEKEAAAESARIKAEQEAATESARIKAEQEAAAESSRIKAEQEAATEAARIKAEQDAAAEAARIKAEKEATEAARIKAEEEAAAEAARIKDEQDAASAAEVARIQAEEAATEAAEKKDAALAAKLQEEEYEARIKAEKESAAAKLHAEEDASSERQSPPNSNTYDEYTETDLEDMIKNQQFERVRAKGDGWCFYHAINALYNKHQTDENAIKLINKLNEKNIELGNRHLISTKTKPIKAWATEVDVVTMSIILDKCIHLFLSYTFKDKNYFINSRFQTNTSSSKTCKDTGIIYLELSCGDVTKKFKKNPTSFDVLLSKFQNGIGVHFDAYKLRNEKLTFPWEKNEESKQNSHQESSNAAAEDVHVDQNSYDDEQLSPYKPLPDLTFIRDIVKNMSDQRDEVYIQLTQLETQLKNTLHTSIKEHIGFDPEDDVTIDIISSNRKLKCNYSNDHDYLKYVIEKVYILIFRTTKFILSNINRRGNDGITLNTMYKTYFKTQIDCLNKYIRIYNDYAYYVEVDEKDTTIKKLIIKTKKIIKEEQDQQHQKQLRDDLTPDTEEQQLNEEIMEKYKQLSKEVKKKVKINKDKQLTQLKDNMANSKQCKSKGIEPIECLYDETEFKRQQLLFHPDLNPGCKDEATIKFQKLGNLDTCKETIPLSVVASQNAGEASNIIDSALQQSNNAKSSIMNVMQHAGNKEDEQQNKDELDDALKQAKDALAALDASEKNAKAVQETLNEVKEQIELQNKYESEVSTSIEPLRNELEAAKQQMEQLTQTNDRLEEQLNQSKKECGRRIHDIETSQQANRQKLKDEYEEKLKTEQQNCQGKIDKTAEDEKKNCEGQIDSKIKEKEFEFKSKSEKEKQILQNIRNQFEQDNQKLQNELSTLKQQLTAKKQSIPVPFSLLNTTPRQPLSNTQLSTQVSRQTMNSTTNNMCNTSETINIKLSETDELKIQYSKFMETILNKDISTITLIFQHLKKFRPSYELQICIFDQVVKSINDKTINKLGEFKSYFFGSLIEFASSNPSEQIKQDIKRYLDIFNSQRSISGGKKTKRNQKNKNKKTKKYR